MDEINASLLPGEELLHEGDGILLRFLNVPSNNQTVAIRPDGRANFYLLDEFRVAGLTVSELSEELTRRYEESLLSPDLTVSLVKRRQRQILILGSEGRRVPLASKQTMGLVEFLSKAGIPRRPMTLLQHLVLMRWMPEEGRRRIWTIDAREEFWNHPVSLQLQADDVVFIPEQPLLAVAQWTRAVMGLLPVPRALLTGGILKVTSGRRRRGRRRRVF